ncbi:MAG: threonine--tRNA ligase [Patescibacteria group bacterium]
MSQKNLELIRHSLAHLLAAAVNDLYPNALPTIGPSIENGFYYDFGNLKISDADLPKIEEKMRELLPSWKEFTKEEKSPNEAAHHPVIVGNRYKKELVDEVVSRGETITFYTSGEFTDLCRGGHAERPAKEIKANSFKLTHLAGAYWRGDSKNPQLTRIYGVAFASKKELDEYIAMLEEAKKRDHKKIGVELDLFLIDEKVGKGLPMWTPKGTAVKFELEKFTRDLERKYGYEHVETPYLGAEELYRISGHLDHFSKNMYAPIDMDGDKFYLRPMACPHHIRMYQRKPWSYKELPVRYAEISDYNRYEKSGELMGMIRVRKFQLTDGHLFIAPEGLKDEFKNVCRMISEAVTTLGLLDIVSYRFSKRDSNNKEKYYPDDKLWNHAEGLMKEALDELGFDYVEAEDEAAFYGPKLDVQAKNVNGKEDTLFTAQIDFLLPQKFNLEYIDANGEKKRPVMIHRSTVGCLERTFAFLIEHYAGAFPLWLSPVQVRVLAVSDKFQEYARKVTDALKTENIRTELTEANETLGKRIRAAETEKIPYTIVLGEKEMNAKTVNLRNNRKNTQGEMEIEAAIETLREEISKKL